MPSLTRTPLWRRRSCEHRQQRSEHREKERTSGLLSLPIPPRQPACGLGLGGDRSDSVACSNGCRRSQPLSGSRPPLDLVPVTSHRLISSSIQSGLSFISRGLARRNPRARLLLRRNMSASLLPPPRLIGACPASALATPTDLTRSSRYRLKPQ